MDGLLCFCGQTHHQNHPEPNNPILIRFSFHSILFICRVESTLVDAQAMLRCDAGADSARLQAALQAASEAVRVRCMLLARGSMTATGLRSQGRTS
jgi:hypothetical protein